MTKTCHRCKLTKNRSDFHPRKDRKDGCRPECKACSREQGLIRYNREKDKINQQCRDYYKEHQEQRIEAAQNYYQVHKEEKATYNKQYKDQNLAKYAFLQNKKNAKKRKATPPWLTKEQFNEIEQFYEDCSYLKALTKVKFEVDHIIPIQNDLVCGLNVPWNLQILTKFENNTKRNKFKPYVK
jgi:hypothetical protein